MSLTARRLCQGGDIQTLYGKVTRIDDKTGFRRGLVPSEVDASLSGLPGTERSKMDRAGYMDSARQGCASASTASGLGSGTETDVAGPRARTPTSHQGPSSCAVVIIRRLSSRHDATEKERRREGERRRKQCLGCPVTWHCRGS